MQPHVSCCLLRTIGVVDPTTGSSRGKMKDGPCHPRLHFHSRQRCCKACKQGRHAFMLLLTCCLLLYVRTRAVLEPWTAQAAILVSGCWLLCSCWQDSREALDGWHHLQGSMCESAWVGRTCQGPLRASAGDNDLYKLLMACAGCRAVLSRNQQNRAAAGPHPKLSTQ
jgi:hypothetical protein